MEIVGGAMLGPYWAPPTTGIVLKIKVNFTSKQVSTTTDQGIRCWKSDIGLVDMAIWASAQNR